MLDQSLSYVLFMADIPRHLVVVPDIKGRDIAPERRLRPVDGWSDEELETIAHLRNRAESMGYGRVARHLDSLLPIRAGGWL